MASEASRTLLQALQEGRVPTCSKRDALIRVDPGSDTSETVTVRRQK